MAADDLSAPLGQNRKPRRTIPITIPQAIVGALGLFAGIFVLWAAMADNPFGGEPMVIVRADLQAAANAPAKKAEVVRPPAIDDQNCIAAFETVDECTQTVLSFGYAGLFHQSYNSSFI